MFILHLYHSISINGSDPQFKYSFKLPIQCIFVSTKYCLNKNRSLGPTAPFDLVAAEGLGGPSGPLPSGGNCQWFSNICKEKI